MLRIIVEWRTPRLALPKETCNCFARDWPCEHPARRIKDLFLQDRIEFTTPFPTLNEPGHPSTEVGTRSPFEQPKRITSGTASRTPLQDLHGTITPSDLHFERHHAVKTDFLRKFSLPCFY